MIRTSLITVGCLAALFISTGCHTTAPGGANPKSPESIVVDDGERDNEGRKKKKKKRERRGAKDQSSGLGLTASGSGGGGAGTGAVLRRAERYAAPPPTGVATRGPAISFTFRPKKAKAGTKVTLTLSAPVGGVEVFFAGDELTSTSEQGGKVLIVTLPKDASSGYLELRVNGQTFKASKQLEVF